jgi:sugar phosphate isomerase/epimerase
MKNKIILSTGSLFHLSIEEIFYIAESAGFDGLELIIDNNKDSTDVGRLKEYIAKYKLPILSVHAPLDNCEVFGDRADSIVQKTLEIAEILESVVVVFHPTRKTYEMYKNDLIQNLKANLDDKVKLVVENMPKNVANKNDEIVYDPELFQSFFKDICLDTSHLATTGLDFKIKIKNIINSVKHVHLADSNFVSEKEDYFVDEHLPCSTGKLDLKWLTQKLSETGYDGMYCIELRPKIFEELKIEEIIEKLSEIMQDVKYLMV